MNKRCDYCKHFDRNDMAVCGRCRNTVPEIDPEFEKRPLLWESKHNDNVNHPSHYETGKFECIDVMVETQGVEAVKAFCLCNAFKYLYRHNGKNGIEDIKKARWYINKYLELEGETK